MDIASGAASGVCRCAALGCSPKEDTVYTRIGIPVFLIIWLIIGAIAAGQRGYFDDEDPNCASVGSTLVTIAAGPLNYIGLNPKIDCPEAPEPSE
jgi:hypothetical protein